jgi:hypothetical protein
MPLESDGASTCGALTHKQTPCQAPAMANGRCRWHGGISPDPPNGIKNRASKSAHVDEDNPSGAKESLAQADEHSGGAIARERKRWARVLDNAVQYSAQSSEIGKWARLGLVVVFAAVGVLLIGSNLWSSSSGVVVPVTTTSEPPLEPPLSPAPQRLAMQANPRSIGDEDSLSPSVRGTGNEPVLLTSVVPTVQESPPPIEPAPVVLDIPVPAEVTTTAQTSTPGTVGGYAARQLNRDEVAALAKRGEEFIAAGDIAAARLVLQRAAEARDARAALLLGATYDPIMLEKSRVRGFAPDIATARTWYERAKEFGSAEATQRLEMLANLQPPSSGQLGRGKTER